MMKEKYYITSENETLNEISKKLKRSEKAIRKINPEIDFNNIKKDMKIEIPKTKIGMIILFLGVLLIGAIICFVFLNPKAKKVTKISLKGNSEIQIEYGNDYEENGYELYINGKIVNEFVEIDTSKVDITKIGTYEVIYKYIDENGKKYETVRIVEVVDKKSPELILKGNEKIKIIKGELYIEAGYEAFDNYDGDLTEKVQVKSLVNIEEVGLYQITYKVCDKSNNCTTKIRDVEVIEKQENETNKILKPLPTVKEENYVIIELKGNSVEYVEYGSAYTEAGYVVRSSDGNIANKVKITGNVNISLLGTYQLIYEITNSKGKTDKAIRTVIVIDTLKPTITLNGAGVITIERLGSYTELGATALDNYDGDITSQIVISGTVNENSIGTYEITYEVSDSSSNKTTIKRTVEVIDTVSPIGTVTLDRSVISNQDVVATLETDEEIATPSGWISIGDNKYTKVFVTNVINETVVFEDLAGNTGTFVFTINLIDKTPPVEVSIVKSQSVPTRANVSVTVTYDKNVTTTSTGWTCTDNICRKTFADNAIENLVVLDQYGNETTTEVSVTNIDKEAPVGTITFDRDVMGNQDITAILEVSEAINTTPSGWISIGDNKYTRVYTSNAILQTVSFTDLAGNSGSVTFNVTLIDKTLPVRQSDNRLPSTVTDQDVLVTLTFSENVKTEAIGWTCIDRVCTKTFTDNSVESVTISDLAGNTIIVPVSIQNIERIKTQGCYTFLEKHSSVEINNYHCHAGNTFGEPVITDLVIEDINGKDVTRINSYAFYQKGLTSVVIPNTVTFITAYAFQNNLLETVTLSSKLTTIGREAFADNRINGTITIPARIELIDNGAFKNNSIETIVFEAGSLLSRINAEAFQNNNLTGTLTLPSNLTRIESSTFQNNKISGTLVIPNKVSYVNQYAFDKNLIEEIVFDSQSQLTSIGMAAFRNNKLSGTLIIPNSVETIDNSAFVGNAAQNSNQIETLLFESGSKLTTIASTAFEYNNLTGTLNIPASVRTISVNAFRRNQLTSVLFESGSQLVTLGGFNENKISGTITIPASVETIGNNAFSGTASGTSNQITTIIYEPSSKLKTISGRAFAYNNLIGYTEIPSSVTSILDEAFLKSDVSNPNLIEIKNYTPLAFDWSRIIINMYTSDYNFNIGTVVTPHGNVEITN